jgi:hypothetical protein
MSRKFRLLLYVLPFVVIVATFVPRYGIDAFVSVPIATAIVYGVLYLARSAYQFAMDMGRRHDS